MCRKCGATASKSEAKVEKVLNPSATREMVIIDKEEQTLPTAKVQCPKCDNKLAYWVIRQTRAADEPETRIYRCTKCGYTWREYA